MDELEPSPRKKTAMEAPLPAASIAYANGVPTYPDEEDDRETLMPLYWKAI
jgi:hypothetical protein